jgi:hypothetical protein
MGIDTTTKPSGLSITIDDTSKYLAHLRKRAEVEGMNDSGTESSKKYLMVTDLDHNFVMEEYYFSEGELYISGSLKSDDGITSIYLIVPVSDTVMMDILQHAIKKFNKLKTALEAMS